MGLIKAATSAIGSTLHDQWKEALRCEEMGSDILMKKVTTPNGVISNGSTVIVGPGQCAIIYDNGRVIEATAEEGIYTFDASSTPSFFAGQFGDVFKEMWQRFTYNGASAKQQAVFFFNLHEIPGATFGTSHPIEFSDWTRKIPNAMCPGEFQPLLVSIRSHGTYTIQITDPALFMQEIAGVADVFRADELFGIDSKWGMQMRSEAEEVLSEVVQEIGTQEKPISVEKLGALRSEIKDIIAERDFKQGVEKRGIKIVNFNIKGVVLTEEAKKAVQDYQLASNSMMQQGKLVGSYANAVEGAANNANGAANGFMGIGMMNMASNGIVGGAAAGPWTNQAPGSVAQPAQPVQQPQQQPAQSTQAVVSTPVATSEEWECPSCKVKCSGKFCQECGTKKPEVKKCANCGKVLGENEKFCSECGTKAE